MSPSELKANVQATGSKFFDRSTMRFFGDTMKNYGVRSSECGWYWELWRKRPVKGGLKKSTYFSKLDFSRCLELEK